MSLFEAIRAKAALDYKQWNAAVDSMRSKTGVFTRGVKVAFKKTVDDAKAFGKGMGTAMKWGGGALLAGGTAAAAGLTAMVKHSADAGDKISKMSLRTGLAAPLLTKLGYAANLSGSSMEDIELATKKMSKTALDAATGSKTAADSFKMLGISVTDNKGRLKSTEVLFGESVVALSKMQNATGKAALAQEIFGRSGTQLLPMLSEGKKGLLGMMKESEQLAYVWSDKTTKSAADMNDGLTRITTIAGGMADRFSAELFPSVTKITEGIVGWYTANKKLIDGKIVEWAGDVKAGIEHAWNSVVGWTKDNTFLIWWERAKLAALGFKVALAGVQSAIDYAIAGYYRLKVAKDFYVGSEADVLRNRQTAARYEKSAATRSIDAVNEYQTQAKTIADLSAVRDTRQARATAQAAPVGGGNVNISISANGTWDPSKDPSAVKQLAESLRRAVQRGQVRPIGG